MHVANEAETLEQVEVAVDGGDVGCLARASGAAGEHLRRERPVGGEQRVEQQPARARQPGAGAPQVVDRLFDGR